MARMIKNFDNKLFLHEAREKQVADFSTKTLNSMNSDHAQQEKNMQTIARQLAKMEERLMSTEALIKTVSYNLIYLTLSCFYGSI